MLRHITVVMLISLTTILLVSQQIFAFTLGVGPIPEQSSNPPVTEPSAVPTPQLIRIAIDPSGARLGVISPTEGYRRSEPALRLRRPQRMPISQPPAPRRQDAQQARASGPAHQLSGAELLLLRKTSVVAEQRGN